ncbi:MAG: hypothetical protein OD815_000307 [Candidatus Alkanophagales archaeon MCA70_species_2]|nr:hypothetical protein [Candidatus Alkanophaga liquidiphilum]
MGRRIWVVVVVVIWVLLVLDFLNFYWIPRTKVEKKLSEVQVAVLYERVTDGTYYFNRSVDDVARMLKDLRADFVFRGWWRWNPCPESSEELPGFFTKAEIEEYARRGYTYKQLRDAVAKIKGEVPGVIFCGAIPAQRLNARERDPITGQTFDREETWKMALDPAKWGITNTSKEELQERLARDFEWVDPEKEYDWRTADAYFPDITNAKFQELFVNWAKKQIDCGVDAIWIDSLFKQAFVLRNLTGDSHHPAVRDAWDAICKIVDEIHRYGRSKEKYIYVGSWFAYPAFPYSPPDLDFVTISPSPEEIAKKELDVEKWNRISELKDRPMFVFMDFGMETLPLYVFSQDLSREEQQELLRELDTLFREQGMIFVYPVHGLIGKSAKKLAFGKYPVYDALAPEFQTYDAIKELATRKKRNM